MDELLKTKIIAWLNHQETIMYIEDERDIYWYQFEKTRHVIEFLNEIGYSVHMHDVNVCGDYVTQYTGISEVQL